MKSPFPEERVIIHWLGVFPGNGVLLSKYLLLAIRAECSIFTFLPLKYFFPRFNYLSKDASHYGSPVVPFTRSDTLSPVIKLSHRDERRGARENCDLSLVLHAPVLLFVFGDAEEARPSVRAFTWNAGFLLLGESINVPTRLHPCRLLSVLGIWGISTRHARQGPARATQKFETKRRLVHGV